MCNRASSDSDTVSVRRLILVEFHQYVPSVLIYNLQNGDLRFFFSHLLRSTAPSFIVNVRTTQEICRKWSGVWNGRILYKTVFSVLLTNFVIDMLHSSYRTYQFFFTLPPPPKEFLFFVTGG